MGVSSAGETSLHFSYQVVWERSQVKWASRWDVYLDMQDTQIHWFSIVNSVVVVFFLSGIITMIIIRTLRRDIAKYNMADSDLLHVGYHYLLCYVGNAEPCLQRSSADSSYLL